MKAADSMFKNLCPKEKKTVFNANKEHLINLTKFSLEQLLYLGLNASIVYLVCHICQDIFMLPGTSYLKEL